MPIKQMLHCIASTLACTAAAFWSVAGLAADYPTKPITVVVGYAAGGGVDAIARIVAEKLPAALGQPVVVENKPSVAGIVSTTFVAKAKPDGCAGADYFQPCDLRQAALCAAGSDADFVCR